MATATQEQLTIGQVAARAGLRTSHIRFYERVGWRAAGPPTDDERFGMPTIAYAREL